jgi:hypothetical protein
MLFALLNMLLLLNSEESFPRLGQMIVDYDPPFKKLSEEFIPHSKVCDSLKLLFAQLGQTAIKACN